MSNCRLRYWGLFYGLYCLVALSGCSIAMALNGRPEPNFDHIKVGSARDEVEFEFGKPLATAMLDDGKQDVTYKYEMGNSPNPARATIYGYYDLATIGLAEPVFTLVELFQGRDEETRVVYNADNRVLEIRGYTPPTLSPELKAAQEEQEKYVRKRPPSTVSATEQR